MELFRRTIVWLLIGLCFGSLLAGCERELINPAALKREVDIEGFRYLKALNNRGPVAKYNPDPQSALVAYVRSNPRFGVTYKDNRFDPFAKRMEFDALVTRSGGKFAGTDASLQKDAVWFVVVFEKLDGTWQVVSEYRK